MGLKLDEMVLEGCKAQDVDFREGKFNRANFSYSDFRHSLFGRTELMEADFSEATDYDIDIFNNKIKGAKFSRDEAIRLLNGLDITLVDWPYTNLMLTSYQHLFALIGAGTFLLLNERVYCDSDIAVSLFNLLFLKLLLGFLITFYCGAYCKNTSSVRIDTANQHYWSYSRIFRTILTFSCHRSHSTCLCGLPQYPPTP